MLVCSTESVLKSSTRFVVRVSAGGTVLGCIAGSPWLVSGASDTAVCSGRSTCVDALVIGWVVCLTVGCPSCIGGDCGGGDAMGVAAARSAARNAWALTGRSSGSQRQRLHQHGADGLWYRRVDLVGRHSRVGARADVRQHSHLCLVRWLVGQQKIHGRTQRMKGTTGDVRQNRRPWCG